MRRKGRAGGLPRESGLAGVGGARGGGGGGTGKIA